MGILDGPILCMIGKYFHKKRNLASGVAFAGSSLGNLAMAPIMVYTIELYSIKGAMFILAGIWLNACVCGALLRPIKLQNAEKIPFENRKPAKHNTSVTQKLYLLDAVLSPEEIEIGTDKNMQFTYIETEKDKEYAQSTVPPNSIEIEIKTHDDISQQYVKDENHFCDLDLYTSQILSQQENMSSRNCCQNSSYLKFLQNSQLMITLCVLGCGMYGYYTPIIIFPAYVHELGLERIKSAWLISALGLVEIFSRIVITLIIDYCNIDPGLLLQSTYIIIGILGQIMVFFPDYDIIMMYACVHGCIGGLCLVLMSSLLCKCAGVEQLGSAMGLAVMELNLAASLSSTTGGL